MIVLIIVLYVFIGAIAATIAYKIDQESLKDELLILVFIGGLWPLLLLIFAGVWIAHKFHEKFIK